MKAKNLILGAFVLFATLPASASIITFDFNSIPLSGSVYGTHVSNTTLDGLNKAADSSLIKAYMDGALSAAGVSSTVTVTGALATAGYSADGFGVGPTLGTSDGATGYTDLSHPSLATPDKFLMNDNFPIFGSASNAITITFTNIALGTVSFDWEIFADNSCSGAPCKTTPSDPGFPQFEFLVDGNHIGASPHTFSAVVIPNQLPQNIGTASFALNLSAGTHTLKFVDWPPEIGIDNLKINTCTERGCVSQQVPEPSPLSLAGLALVLLALVRWKTTGRTASIIAG